jgi:hypothetical protein
MKRTYLSPVDVSASDTTTEVRLGAGGGRDLLSGSAYCGNVRHCEAAVRVLLPRLCLGLSVKLDTQVHCIYKYMYTDKHHMQSLQLL